MAAKPELLCPAGDRERLDMALAYGADAVYLAGNAFGMRAFAGNFDREGLAAAVEAAHAKGVRVHVTCNTLARNHEAAQLPEYLEYLDSIGADAVIAAGVEVLDLCKRHAPHVQVHMSTQTGITNYEAARVWHELGASRVILARELSLDEVAELKAKAPRGLEVECFVHGAMCVSWSGRCLLSNYMTGRDASRGACAQPCRYQYALMEEKRPGEYFPVFEENGETFIMNSRDMCMIDHIPELLQAGVDSLKIEGRAKSAYYAAMTAAAYRHGVDAAAEGRPLDPVWRAEVDKVSHRHYSTGFWFGQPGQYTDSARYVRDWQVLAVVESCDGLGNARLSLRNKFAAGDEIEVVGPGVPAFLMSAPMMRDVDGFELREPRNPRMEFYMRLPRPAPPLSIVRACRPSS
ncbi:MAG: U32 family peptidase [Oscillospiraceae bacterium]|jgi:putative protease|nr:U32 family peptidase [Oscillospiraceae bacterium]